jgi:acyl-CoA reductase-like NAD-dependent aldehyde dehydrogenase
LGVVAILSPWNYPIHLALLPLVGALAAGNRAVVKPAEATPRTATALADLLAAGPGPSIVCCVLGGPDIAAALVRLPFDHILFTGGAERGRDVMRAAADNLTPVTLELGGKCPAVLMPDADLERAARSLVLRKGLNAGQTCVAPDTLLVVGRPLEPVREALRRAHGRHFPVGLPTAVISAACRERLQGLTAGCELEPLGANPANGLTLALDPPPASAVLIDEVFGPVLPVRPVPSLDAALGWIGARAAPLAVYLYTRDRRAERTVLERTRAGALVVNDSLIQAAMDTLPFGGVGASGFGRYHGRAGFDTFSNQRSHVRAARFSLSRLVEPPYGLRKRRLIERLLG